MDSADRIYEAAAEWAAARRAAMKELQAPTTNVSVSMARMAKAEAALYALFPNAE